MVKYKCKNCGKEKQARYKSHIRDFCCKKCSMEYRWAKKGKTTTTLVCEKCGKEFKVKSYDYRLTHNGIKYCSKKCAGEGLKKGSIVKCKQCGKEFYSTRNEFCSRACVFEYRSKNSPHKEYSENGYIVEHKRGYNKKGNAKQHRVIMEGILGRKLLDNEVVHHINGNKADNRIENLEVMTRGEHSRLHRLKEISEQKGLFGRK